MRQQNVDLLQRELHSRTHSWSRSKRKQVVVRLLEFALSVLEVLQMHHITTNPLLCIAPIPLIVMQADYIGCKRVSLWYPMLVHRDISFSDAWKRQKCGREQTQYLMYKRLKIVQSLVSPQLVLQDLAVVLTVIRLEDLDQFIVHRLLNMLVLTNVNEQRVYGSVDGIDGCVEYGHDVEDELVFGVVLVLWFRQRLTVEIVVE
mmetsp:Transcript_66460/g.105636  ORF Transcript_66460/g.105636 Transcript_66460/m.105636 type:complete len:203 (+) Transcript_66460:282-890(+)